MLMLIASILLADSTSSSSFPERVPGLMEACLVEAVDADEVSETEDSHKYMCGGEPALRFWTFLESANVPAYEQDVGEEGHWLSRDFPMGGCFKRIRKSDGSPATTAISCSIWIPRPAR